ncbi:hypothetical protein [Lactococcus lactis]|uniref:hypothetical protein n=1 Tax=Lactococcus lactis TaxID=1358 RepID=UPI000CE3652D|nr:hypothetical protein [Lactococcus lactis]PPA67022.1 hypothetical protein C3952_08955 [Lactococcus lactis]DAL92608.1 MAG TPA: hypothetical protein [Caudoviricetes sp.]
MNDFNQDMQNLLNAYDSNWEDYLILREQFIEKYSLSVEKLQEIRVEELKDFNSKILQAELKNQKFQEQLNTAKKALTEISVIPTKFDDGGAGEIAGEIAHDALAAIGNEGSGDE